MFRLVLRGSDESAETGDDDDAAVQVCASVGVCLFVAVTIDSSVRNTFSMSLWL